MRKFLCIVLSMLILSCSSSKSAGKSDVKLNKRMLKGTWMVDGIRFVGEKGIYKAKVFDLSDSPCFKGSEWIFVSNNGTGKFSLPGSGNCESKMQRILWSFNDEGNGKAKLQFKLVDTHNKPLSNDQSGFEVGIQELSATNFELHVHTTYDKNPFDVVMTFHKVSSEVRL